jgi:hypothetical protein
VTGFAEAVAANLFKLMAYQDEYEVARLCIFTPRSVPTSCRSRRRRTGSNGRTGRSRSCSNPMWCAMAAFTSLTYLALDSIGMRAPSQRLSRGSKLLSRRLVVRRTASSCCRTFSAKAYQGLQRHAVGRHPLRAGHARQGVEGSRMRGSAEGRR